MRLYNSIKAGEDLPSSLSESDTTSKKQKKPLQNESQAKRQKKQKDLQDLIQGLINTNKILEQRPQLLDKEDLKNLSQKEREERRKLLEKQLLATKEVDRKDKYEKLKKIAEENAKAGETNCKEIREHIATILEIRGHVIACMKNHSMVNFSMEANLEDIHGFIRVLKDDKLETKEAGDLLFQVQTELNSMLRDWIPTDAQNISRHGLPETIEFNVVTNHSREQIAQHNIQVSKERIARDVSQTQGTLADPTAGTTQSYYAALARSLTQPAGVMTVHQPYMQIPRGKPYVPKLYDSVSRYDTHDKNVHLKCIEDYKDDWEEPSCEPNTNILFRTPKIEWRCPEGYFCTTRNCNFYHTLRMNAVFKTKTFQSISDEDLRNDYPTNDTINAIIRAIYEVAPNYPRERPRHSKEGLKFHEDGTQYIEYTDYPRPHRGRGGGGRGRGGRGGYGGGRPEYEYSNPPRRDNSNERSY